jgi:hypothetical protein
MPMQDHEPDPRFVPPDDRRFTPPGEDATRVATRRLRFIILLIAIAAFIVPQWQHSHGARGWAALIAALGVFLLVVVQFGLQRIVAERENPDHPYSRPPDITR